jgi:[glutamine synthetase] adenylyltransferase / [glutamine synthetase]-adenylyl-L-tyrosine phosphorylase
MAVSLSCSPALQALLDSRLVQLRERAPRTCALLDLRPELMLQLRKVLCGSDFVQRAFMRDDDLLESLWQSGALAVPRSREDYVARVSTLEADHAVSEAQFGKALRQLRRAEMVRLVWRDLTGAASLHDTLRETSWFAESAIAGACRVAAALLAPRHGPPADAGGLVVLGMGKLGGEELNFSSDVDLVFLYPRGGETAGPVPLALEDYYVRQGQLLIRLLDGVTEEGFVFRVDMRLRPFGDSGPLAVSFAFFEDYLQTQGRDWERYAYIKARPLTQAPGFEALRQEALRPFVFRRYLDFGVFDSLREMKALIARDVVRRDRAASLKLGVGGIREIEFIVQAFQLVRGGQDGALRQQSLLKVLPHLAGVRLLPADAVQELAAAYDFLRLLENRVQMLDDAQTHDLPVDPLERERIAASAGFADAAEMEARLAAHRECVSRHFTSLFADGGSTAGRALDLAPLWEAALDRAPLREQLQACAEDADALLTQLMQLCNGSVLRRLDDNGRKRLKALLELLLVEQQAARNTNIRRRVFSVLEAIGLRSAYFSLLVENRRAREQLVEVCRDGDFLAAQLARSPSLLDELLDERWKHELPDRAALADELRHRLEEVPDDIEREVEALARFKQSAVFRVALADLTGRLPLMSVSDRLTEIAAIIVEYTMALAQRQISLQIGAPHCIDAGVRRSVRICALGYGKFGGFELGYGSDLDLVFLHDSRGEQQETDAASPVDNQVFFLRFAQRLIHLLTMHSVAGRLYEVDVRLRPSGKGGMLVTSVDAFRRYQFEEAWTWEHQALLHARAVAGDPQLMARVEAVRNEVLQGAVRRDDLRDQVAQMRERMRRELSAAKSGQFDLKQDRGGVADIEFLAQYWALRWAKEFPPVVHYSDTIRQLESVASAALVPQHTVDVLVRAYQQYRQVAHRRSLEGLDAVVAAGEFAADRAAVAAIWRATMQEPV